MFAVSSIEEAYYYYELIKKMIPDLKVSATFDSSDNYSGDMAFNKEDAIVSIVKDYNSMFNQKFDASNFNTAMKKDIQFRLAHIESYKRIENEPEKQLDMLIVVDQMLTGYNSKWLNTLFLDKMLKYQGLIQSFSRTNRLNGPDKKHGNIRYFRMPHTMKQNIEIAVKAYSGDRPFSIFVDKLGTNILNINLKFNEIQNLFNNNKISNFERLPEDKFEIKKFVESFNNLTYYLESARIQGLNFKQSIYILEDPITKNKKEYELKLSENTYNILQ